MELDLKEAAIQGNVEPFLAACRSFPNFSAAQQAVYMARLAEHCRPTGILSYIESGCCCLGFT